MSKRSYISRYLLIIRKLQHSKYASFEEIAQYIEQKEANYQQLDDLLQIGCSKRTFQRDIKEIKTLFGIDIDYDRREKAYYLTGNNGENMNFISMMEHFEVFNMINHTQQQAQFIHVEQRKAANIEFVPLLMSAIKQGKKITFTHQKLGKQEKTTKKVAPYGLKEYKNRWYLIAKNELGKPVVLTYALDRIEYPEILEEYFETDVSFDLNAYFQHSFGIIRPDKNDKIQDIILSFTASQGEYIKRLPLHSSQEILLDNASSLKVKLKMFVTYDFEMELLSYGEHVQVLEPASLRNSIQQKLTKASQQYIELPKQM